MSIREKDFIKALRKAGSERDLKLRYRQLGEWSSRYLRSRFADNAIVIVERTVLNKRNADGEIPEGLEDAFLEAARYYSRNDEFDRAEELLSEVESAKNMTVALQAKYEADLIKLKRQLEQGTIDEKTIEDIKDVVKDDEEHELETLTAGEFSEYDLFRSYFGERIPVSDLTEEIFPSTMRRPIETRVPPDPDVPPHPSNDRYDERLSANNRLRFLVENFPIVSGSPGDGKFRGSILFEIEGSDLVIVENFWRQTRSGEIAEDYGKATYILPKDQAIDLIKLSRGEICAKKEKDPRINTVEHYPNVYYNNLVEKFNNAQSAELQKIELKSNPLENDEAREIPNIESHIIEEDSKVVDEVSSGEKKTRKKNDILLRDFNSENREFLSRINDNIGGILTPDIMEELAKKASYSFKDLYDDKLKDEILGRLKILEVPEENREIEVQKAFLYLRMTKNISMIKSGAINGQALDNLLDDTTIEYDKGFDFFEKHIGDSLTYRNLRKLMKEYVETEIDPLEQPQEKQDRSIEDDEKFSKQPNTAVRSDTEKGTKIAVLDFATKYAELLERLAEVDAEGERLDIKLAEKEQSHSEKQQATIQAREAEERARRATIEATEQETKSGRELDEMRAEREKLAKEKRELEDKKSKIDSILGGGDVR
ncbi:MAG: hypothetical protein ACI4VE_01360 [Clostridia bacterium]